jgi:nucleotide-binding universal stress UspA family protein
MSRVIVGLADRPGTERTLGWAVTEAIATGARLVVVRAEVRRPRILSAAARSGGPAMEEADPVLARAMGIACGPLGDDRLFVVADRDSAGKALVRAARTGDLLVVGAPTVSGWWGRGSTTYHVMTRALCPVVAVHDPALAISEQASGHSFRGQVVVGVDGSPAAHAGLNFAFAYAQRHQVALVAAMTTRHPVEDVWFDDQMLETHLGSEPAEAAMLAADIEPWHLRYPGVAVRRALVADDAVAGLRRVSRGAALLVVGTAADRAAPLGRVSRSLVEWADCPVAVVRIAP